MKVKLADEKSVSSYVADIIAELSKRGCYHLPAAVVVDETWLINVVGIKGLRALKREAALKPIKLNSPRQHYILTL